jgi:hypothetical protein
MKLSISILTGLFLFISSERVKAQDCHNNEEFVKQVGKQIQTEFSMFDSLHLIYFVKYKVNSKGKINSVWISGIDFMDTDYNEYIKASNGKALNLYYGFQSKENEIRKRIYSIYSSSKILLCEKSKKRGYFLQTIQVSMPSYNSSANFRNIDDALFELQNTCFEKLFILRPLKIVRPNRNRL